MLPTLSSKVLDAMNRAVIYIYEWYQQQPIAITQCLMGWNQSSDGSTMEYLVVLKIKRYEN